MKKFLFLFIAVSLVFCGLTACKKDKEPEYYYLWEYSYVANDYVLSETSYILLDNGSGKIVRPEMGREENFSYVIDGQNITFSYDSSNENGFIKDGVILLDNEYYCNSAIASSPYKSVSGINYSVGNDGNYIVTGVQDNKLTSVEIPSEIDGVKVTAIGIDAFANCSDLKNVTLNDGIKKIESAAFRSCNALSEINFPSSLEIIGSNAFEYCKSLTSLELPNGLKQIDAFAFRACTSLYEISFPDTLTVIGFNSFANCSVLREIDIPQSVTSVETGAFQFCPTLMKITVDPSNAVYSAVGNCLIENETKTLIFGCAGSVIPSEGIKHIAANAFIGGYAEPNLNIPTEVKTIGENAFANCSEITSIIINGLQTKISQSAFINCPSLTSVEIYGNGVEIGRNAFLGCSQLSELSLYGVSKIGESAFAGCVGLTELTIPDSVESISDNAFGKCLKLTTAFIGANVMDLGLGIFRDCTKLISLTVSPQNLNFYSQDDCIIERSSLVLVCGNNSGVIPDNIRYIAGYAFKGFTIKEIVLSDAVVAIYGCAFQDCGELTSVTMGRSVQSISDHVFYGCGKLSKIIFKGDENSWNQIEKDPYWNDGAEFEIEFLKAE